MRQLLSSGSTDYIAFAVTGICVLIISLIYVWWLERSSGKLSCPGLLPKHEELGNLAEVTPPGGLHQFLLDHHGKLGPIFSFFWGKDIVVSLGSSSLFNDVAVLFERSSEQYELLKAIIGPKSLEFFNSPEGQRHGNVMERHCTPAAVQRFFPGFLNMADQLVSKWSSATKGDHIPVNQHLLAISVKSVIRTAFGEGFFKTNGEILQLQEAFSVCWDQAEQSLHGEDVELERETLFKEKLTWIQDKIKEVIQHRKSTKKESRDSLVDVLLKEEDLYPTEDCMVDAVVAYVISGFYTTGHLVSWAVYLLCLHPEVADKLNEEICQVVGDAELSFEHCKKLHYLEKVINETLRCSALVPVAVQSSFYDLMVGGHVIPKNIPFVQACGVVLQDPFTWSEPKKFDPERFAPEEVSARHPMAFQTVGFAGKRLVRYEAYVYVASIVREFRLQLVDGQELKYRHGLLTQFSDEVWITAQPRLMSV